jgi:hypothetical protein
MRTTLAIMSIALTALSGSVNAAPRRACDQVAGLIDAAVSPLLASLAQSQPEATQLHAQIRACLSSRNICSVLHNTRIRENALVEGDTTPDLPQGVPGQGQSSAIAFLARSIPRVRNDTNQYCLITARSAGTASGPQWDVYGWVIAPNASEALPLQRQNLNSKAVYDPGSLRSLAAALWFYAQRMSGQPLP